MKIQLVPQAWRRVVEISKRTQNVLFLTARIFLLKIAESKIVRTFPYCKEADAAAQKAEKLNFQGIEKDFFQCVGELPTTLL